jgi:AcrR family transcriptional regulator
LTRVTLTTPKNELGFGEGSWQDWDVEFFMARSVAFPAPGRGFYDRALTRVERDAAHRERLLRATAEVLSEGPLTVARIVQRAGVGRSTFYEFFDSPEHLLEQLEQRLLRSLEGALDAALGHARTPLERVRAITRAWTNVLEEREIEARVVLTRRPGGELLSSAGKLFHQTLQRCVHAARTDLGWFETTDEVSVLAAAAAVEAVSRHHLAQQVHDAPRTLAELIIKLLR